MSRDEVHAIAQGRVWTGDAAKQRGLVDEIGGLEQAIAAAQDLAKVDATLGFEVYPAEPTLKDFLGSFEQLAAVQAGVRAGVRADGLPLALGVAVDSLAASVGPEGAAWVDAVGGALHTATALQGSHVWAVEWIRRSADNPGLVVARSIQPSAPAHVDVDVDQARSRALDRAGSAARRPSATCRRPGRSGCRRSRRA